MDFSKIVMSKCDRVQGNPFIDLKLMDHWKITLVNKLTRKQVTFIYSQGYDFKGEKPKVDKVIDQVTELWLYSQIGHDEIIENIMVDDHNRAEKIYKEICRIGEGYRRITQGCMEQ